MEGGGKSGGIERKKKKPSIKSGAFHDIDMGPILLKFSKDYNHHKSTSK